MTGTSADQRTDGAEGPSPADGPAGAPQGQNIVDRVSDRIDHLQRRIPPVAVVHGVLKKYGEDRGGQLAMLLAYRGFFAVFPLLLALVNVLGLILQDNDELRENLIDSALSNVPIIGDEILRGAELGGSVPVIIGSVLVSLWAGLGLLEMLQEALNTVWGVPLFDRPNWFLRKARDLPGAVLIALCLVLSGSRSWIAGGAPEAVGDLLAFVLPFLAGALCYLGLHALLCARKVPFTAQLPGAGFVGLSWFALQSLGEWYVNRFVVQSSDRYGVFVVVFGILSWSYLLGLLYLYGNELSSVLWERSWPRSLTGRNLTEADQAAYARVSEREVRVRGTSIDVDVPQHPAQA